MSEQIGGDTSWIGDPSQSLAPSRRSPDRPISRADLADQLANAPEAPAENQKGADDGGYDAGSGPGSAADERADRGEDGRAEKPPNPSGDQGGGARRRGRPRGEIFDGSPVKPLGIYGDLSFYLDVRGQLRAIDNHSLDKIRHVFGGRIGLLANYFPQFDKDGCPKPGKFDQNNAAFAMVQACEEQGVWSPTGRVRGSGAWTDEDGNLIYHAGNQILMDGCEWVDPGVYDGKVYSAADKIPKPADKIGRHDPGQKLLELISSWNWRRKDVDPQLMLGAIAAQMLGGALEWRPVTWLTGDAATGKSTFQKLLKNVHGGSDGLLQASDATEAGIRSVIGYSSLPVALDELEPSDDPRDHKARNIIKLARIAASGDQILRGSTDQKGYQGNAYSCFIFSSILVPPLPPQDRSRLILLDLNEIPKDARRLDPDWRQIRNLGAGLRRRLIDGWDSWHERLEMWRGALATAGYGGRHADNYGTVLAMADMALHEDLPSEDVLIGWVEKLAKYLVDDTAEVGSNAQDMLGWLLGQPLDVWRRGMKYNVATWLAMAGRLPGSKSEIETATPDNANDHLAQYGLRVRGREGEAELAIANRPVNQLGSLFEGSPWADGVWRQAARRVHGAYPAPSAMSFARNSSRATWIPFKSIPGIMDFPQDKASATDVRADFDAEDFA